MADWATNGDWDPSGDWEGVSAGSGGLLLMGVGLIAFLAVVLGGV